MFLYLSFVRPAKADDPDGIVTRRECQDVQSTVKESERQNPTLAVVLSFVVDEGRVIPIKLRELCEIASVLGDVAKPLFFIPYNLHAYLL
jgi:hypothetical protein